MPYNVVPGQTVYSLIEPEFSNKNEWEIDDEVVTEVGSRGFFISGNRPAEEDMSIFVSWEEIGKEVFLSRNEAMAELASKNEKGEK